MAVKLYAAIVIGSMETEMKIYELSSRKGMKEVDCVSTRINLGVDAYSRGRLDTEKVDELCRVLKDFKRIMEGYKVDAYRVCGTSALREIRSTLITKDYIEKQTGLPIDILSNSEQRFLDYKSIASESDSFENIISSGTAIVDIGGNSMQISVFDKDKLITTQNIRMGKVSTREKFLPLAKNSAHFEKLMVELMDHELNGFGKLYQKDRQIKNLIVIDSDLLALLDKADAGSSVLVVGKEEFMDVYRRSVYLSPDEITQQFGLSADSAPFVVPSMIFSRCLLDKLGAEDIWIPRMSATDGMCYEYAVNHKMIRSRHNFDEDIIAASRNIAKRYKSNQAHVKNMEELTLQIFDKMKKIHGLGQRERLLLQISAILHNCGKYISLTNVAECAYNIIMATEIIGLSHAERQIIANVVKFNTLDFCYYDELASNSSVSREEYLVIAKLTAILRLANALDRSHKQKFKNAVITLRDEKLMIAVESQEDLTLEKGTLAEKADFFEEVFNIHPVVKQRKKM
ncbi:MAG: exopolyphosphatase [Lachnospiraceae bacterium]|nr:exopolyphosphatase [Lachnospiraceae bacterium]